jgi:NADH-quinone oxidoreductase subunit L
MITEAAAWWIIGLPLASFIIISFVIRPLMGATRVSGYTTVAAMAGSLALSIWALGSVTGEEGAIGFEPHSWLTIGAPGGGVSFDLQIGILLDSLTAIMLIVVTGVSLMVQVYSQGYMRGDGGYSRYFAYMSLFTASMLGLVLSRNLVQLFAFWELVGLSSYLLIGFWHDRPAAAAAAKKAFLVTRIGDFGFLLALLYIFYNREVFTANGLNPFDIPDIHIAAGILGTGVVTWIAVGLFAGAMGKSAQFPLHTWLPDAMEGPTPVSSLIHAATMVAAGVFLVARMFPLFEHSVVAMNIVAIIGGFTAIFAASMALVSNDIKRVLAYSTVSQLGYMMLALGVGAPVVAMFHLFTHAFFKCLLFLGAGSVNHATGTFDMRYMGGLRKTMPITYATTVIAGLSLAGIFPLAGFWSKDEVLSVALEGEHAASSGVSILVFWLALAAVLMTSFYIFRLIFMTFHGEFRGGVEAQPEAERSPGEHYVHLAESPMVMWLPMALLALAAVGAGFLANPTFDFMGVPAHAFSEFLHEEAGDINWILAAASTGVALAGILLATLMYQTKQTSPTDWVKATGPIYKILSQRYYIDALYEGLIVRRALHGGLFRITAWFDERVVDGLVDLAGWSARSSGRALSMLQTGQVQAYGAGISVGVIATLVAYLTQT